MNALGNFPLQCRAHSPDRTAIDGRISGSRPDERGLRWTFDPLGDLFVVYDHNLRDLDDRLSFDSNQLLVKAQYTWRY